MTNIPKDPRDVPIGIGGLAETDKGLFKPEPDQSVPAKEVIPCVVDGLPVALEETKK